MARSVPKIFELPDNVRLGKTGDTLVFRPAKPVGKMTVAAGTRVWSFALTYRRRHRRMLIWKPVRNGESIRDVSLRVSLATAGNIARSFIGSGRGPWARRARRPWWRRQN